MTRTEFLEAAKKCICGDRDKQYGSPEDSFQRVAKLWGMYLNKVLVAEDVAILMCLFKITRIESSDYLSTDSWVDLIGYAACGGEIAERRKS